jgi:hypothetical protein
MTGHSTAHNVFSHICIKQLCISFTRYIHTPTAQACPFKNTSLIVFGILISLLPPLSSCNLNLATYQIQRKIKKTAKAPSYRVLLSFFSFCLFPKFFPHNTPALSTVRPLSFPSLSFSTFSASLSQTVF